MTDKEQMAKLYDFLKHDVEVSFLDGDVIDVAMDVISKHIERIKKLEKQNKCYRESLELIKLKTLDINGNKDTRPFQIYGIASDALEGDLE